MTMKKICSGCGKIIDFNKDCTCRPKRVIRKEKNSEDDKFLRSTTWYNKRRKIIQRDNGYCQRCFYKFGILETERLQVHHIKSRLHYPELKLEDSNLITVCQVCNLQLGTKDILDFKWEVPKEEDEINIY